MTSLAFHPILAEISDKMPGMFIVWIVGCILAVVAVGCCRVSKWLYLLMIPVASWLAYAGWHDNVADRYFHDAIVTELGKGCLIQSISASFVPLVALLACGLHDLARWRPEQGGPANGSQPFRSE